MNLFPVRLDKTDTCLSYVLKRVGLGNTVKSLLSIHSHFNLIPFSRESAKNGDIVYWNARARKVGVFNEITREGVIVENQVTIKIHVAVIENLETGEISDCVRKIAPEHIPSIRMINLSDDREPDFILKLK